MKKNVKRFELSLLRAIADDKRMQVLAAKILKEEHGIKHQPGERTDLCPSCVENEVTTPFVRNEASS
jgi:hypothetical protein